MPPLSWNDVERDREIGARLKAQRKLNRLTLVQLAECLGISHEQLRRYESGHHSIKASTLEQVAQELGVTIHHFYEPAANAPALNVTDDIMQLARRIADIRDDAARNAICRMIGQIAENKTVLYIEIA